MKQIDLEEFPSVRVAVDNEACVIVSGEAMWTLSSGVLGGGFQETRTIINRHVEKNYNQPDPVRDLRMFAKSRKLAEPVVGLMTGVGMDKIQVVKAEGDGLVVTCILTASVGNAVAAGSTQPVPLRPGTINGILLVSARLSEGAMVNAVITATEAKTLALTETGVRTVEGYGASGTSTDAVVIACVGGGNKNVLPYAGPATMVGYLMGVCVRMAVREAVRAG